jgi:hypothetical protein
MHGQSNMKIEIIYYDLFEYDIRNGLVAKKIELNTGL